MDKQELVAEEEYLAKTITLIKDKLEKNEKLMAETKGGVSDLISYISTQFYDLDPEERSSLSQFMGDGDYALSEALRLNAILKRQKSSPYFGRFDFFSDDEKTANSYYLGINSLCEDGNSIPTICDWRAPISTMYYDFEKGRGFYDAPIGRIDGEILLKRQYKIKNGKMNYCFDSNLTIDDEILQEALSHASDSKMKNIVTTIQKEQNQIIRSDLYNTLVVQGVAGSGKTSIALHRVAFLLYKYKQKIRSKDILIISPNKIFSDYISNVLPELGEANVEETTFFELAREELKDICIFEDRADMQNAVLFGDEKRIAEIQTKNGKDFFEKLEKYLRESITFSFDAEDIKVGDKTIGKEKIDSLYRERYSGKDVSLRIEWIAEYVVDQLDVKAENPIGMIARIKNKLLKMFKENSILKLYALFLKSEGLEYLTNESNLVRFEDVCPILFIKDYMLGIQKYKNVKYVIIDEMQDYGLMAFVIMNKMFNC
ncbi:MAG: AAA family ATPase, partial [Clostridia bacterium]